MKNSWLKKIISCATLLAFVFTNAGVSFGTGILTLPVPGEMVELSSSLTPPILKGLRVDPGNPFKFEFILDTGSDIGNDSDVFLHDESLRLIRYFLAALTIPEKDLWVNLSPYERDRIIPDEFGLTEMGRDLLAQDYILKQITASLIYPENETGRIFWAKVYARAYEMYGTTDIPTDTFNKVWIVPDKARVYENGTNVFVVESSLKVMLESDYIAQAESQKDAASSSLPGLMSQSLSEMQKQVIEDLQMKSIIRDVVIPVLEKEVNEGANFTQLRQVYHSLILAKWYKETLKESVINRKYSDQKKTGGVDLAGKDDKQVIYEKYLDAFKKGTFNYIKEEYDQYMQETIPRKYFSGGMDFAEKVHIEREYDLPEARASGTLKRIAGDFLQTASSGVEAAVDAVFFLEDNVVSSQWNETSTLDETVKDFAEQADGTVSQKIARNEYLRASTSDILRQGYWASDVMDSLNRIVSKRGSVRDVQAAITALRNSDMLGRMLEIEEGKVVMFRNDMVKTFNDEILGKDDTDMVIGHLRSELVSLMGRPLVYSSYYKEMPFSFKEGEQLPDLDNILQQAWSKVMKRLIGELEKRLEKAEAGSQEQKDIQKKIQALYDRDVLNPDAARKFISFGVAQTEGSSDRDKVLSFLKASQAIVMAKAGVTYGAVDFSWDNFREAMIESDRLKSRLKEEGMFVSYIRNGRSYDVIKNDVFKVMRKRLDWAKLSSDMQQIFNNNESLYQEMLKYYNLLGLVDFIKQWQMDFNAAVERSRQINAVLSDLEYLKKNMGTDATLLEISRVFKIKWMREKRVADEAAIQDLFENVRGYIGQNPKILSVDSDLSYYNKTMSAKEDFDFISIDVPNMGGQNTVELSILMEDIKDVIEKDGEDVLDHINDLLMTSADKVTLDFQGAPNVVMDIFGDGVKAMRMGGDELIVALEKGRLTPEKMIDLKNRTGVRIASTESAGFLRQYFLEQKRETLEIAHEGFFTGPEIGSKRLSVAAALMRDEDLIDDVKKKLGDGNVFLMERVEDGELVLYKYSLAPNGEGYFGERVDRAEAVHDGLKGGIDFNSSLIDLQRQGQRAALDWGMDDAQLENVNIDGLVPVITGITPVDNFPFLMGVESGK